MGKTLDELIRQYGREEGSRLRRAARIEAAWKMGQTDLSRGIEQRTRQQFRDAMEYDAYLNGYHTRQTNPMTRPVFNSVRVIMPNGKERRLTLKQLKSLADKHLGASAEGDLFSLAKRLHDKEVFTLHALRGAQYTRPGRALETNRLPKRRRGPWPRGRTPPHLRRFLFK